MADVGDPLVGGDSAGGAIAMSPTAVGVAATALLSGVVDGMRLVVSLLASLTAAGTTIIGCVSEEAPQPMSDIDTVLSRIE